MFFTTILTGSQCNTFEKSTKKSCCNTITFTCFATSLEMLSERVCLRSSLFGTKQQVALLPKNIVKGKLSTLATSSLPLPPIPKQTATVKLLSGETSLQTAGKENNNNNNNDHKATNNHRGHRYIREEQACVAADSGSVVRLLFHIDYKSVKHRWRLDDCKYSAAVSMLQLLPSNRKYLL